MCIAVFAIEELNNLRRFYRLPLFFSSQAKADCSMIWTVHFPTLHGTNISKYSKLHSTYYGRGSLQQGLMVIVINW